MESIDVNIDEDLPKNEIEDHEVDPLIEENEEEPEKEEKDQEKQKEKELSQTHSKVKFLQKHHLEENIIGNVDEGDTNPKKDGKYTK